MELEEKGGSVSALSSVNARNTEYNKYDSVENKEYLRRSTNKRESNNLVSSKTKTNSQIIFQNTNAKKIQKKAPHKKVQHKKAQVTFFIILGAVILAMIIAGYYFMQHKSESISTKANAANLEGIKPVQTFVEQCLYDTTLKATFLAAVQGGSIALAKPYTTTETGAKVVYGIAVTNNPKSNDIQNKERVKTLPTTKEMEADIAAYIDVNLANCIGNFSSFAYNITSEKPTATVTVADDKVIANLKFPIIINNAGSNKIIDQFQAQIPLRLGHLQAIASAILDDQLKNSNWLNLDAYQKYDVKVDFSPINEDTIMLVISDGVNVNSNANSNKNQNTNAELVFLTPLQFIVNKAPVLTIDSSFVIKDAQSFTTKVLVADESPATVKLTDDSILFSIEQDGTISFTPEVPGEYFTTITAEDDKGAITKKTIKFTIVT